jgi:hypothetical protein
MKVTARKTYRRLLSSVVAIAAVSAAVAASAGGATSPSPSPIPSACQLVSPQPEAPLQSNLVGMGSLAKTLTMETEVFDCYDAKSTLASVKEVQTLIEFVDRSDQGKHDKSPHMTALGRSATAETCTKDLKAGTVACKSVNLPLGVTTTPLAHCSVTKGTYPFPVVTQPTHPLELDTVKLSHGMVKSVAVQKEVFDCAGQIGDVYLFTEVNEFATGSDYWDKATGFSGAGTQFEGVVCLKSEATATVVSCKLFTPATAK